MPPDTLPLAAATALPPMAATAFQIANVFAIGGWLVLAVMAGSGRPALGRQIGRALAALISVGYAVLMAANFAGSDGGFRSLAGVSTLMSKPLAAAGRVAALPRNVTTPWYAILYALMGLMATGITVATFVIGWRIWQGRHACADGSARRGTLAHATGLGFMAGNAGALLTGIALGVNGGHFVGAHDAAPAAWSALSGWAWLGWNRSGGDLRVSHFIALHLMQALPLMALAAGRHLPVSQVRKLTWFALIAGLVLAAWAFGQAMAGHPFPFGG